MHNVCVQTALERKLGLTDRTHIPLATGMRGHVIVVISEIVMALITDLASEFSLVSDANSSRAG